MLGVDVAVPNLPAGEAEPVRYVFKYFVVLAISYS